MREVQKLLQLLTELVPPNENMRHNITLKDDHLVLTLMISPSYQSVVLRDSDLDRDAEELAGNICIMLGVKL